MPSEPSAAAGSASESTYQRLGCACIDVHTHVVPHSFPAYAGRAADAAWPSTADARPCHRHVMIQGKVYRTVSHQSWDAQVRIADMDRTQVSAQVLSPMPELLSYWLAPQDARSLCRFLNEAIAQMVGAHPGRFHGLGAVPLQDVELAIGELEFAMREFGLQGVEIGSNINGTPIGDPRFLPFFAACEALGAPVFVHALRPAGMDRLVGPPAYEQALAFPGEIGLAAVSMITGGTIARLPKLRIAFSHGGGSLQVLIPRLEQAWHTMPGVKESLAEPPTAGARRMYYDDLLYAARPIESLVQLVGATQVMAGTDYPFVIMDKEPARRIESLALSKDEQRLLTQGNALRWLGLR